MNHPSKGLAFVFASGCVVLFIAVPLYWAMLLFGAAQDFPTARGSRHGTSN